MISLSPLWQFIASRPGLDACGMEWRECLGDATWDALRKHLFVGDGIAARYRRPGDDRTFQVVPAHGGYQLVCDATGNVEARDVLEIDVRRYRLDAHAMRSMIAEALGVVTEPGLIKGLPRAFPLGDWRPMDAVMVPALLMFPPTIKVLVSEIQRLLLDARDGFVLLVPKSPRIDRSTRDLLNRKQATVIALEEILTWDGSTFCATPMWQTYRDAYCARHLSDQTIADGPEHQFAKKGMWAIRFAGKETFLDGNLKGAAFIHHLLAHQGQRIHVVRLMAHVAGVAGAALIPEAEGLATDRAKADEVVDQQTIKKCRERYDHLVAEREHADDDRISTIETEIAEIAAYLSSALGLGGRSRTMDDEVAKARRRIARVINIAYEKIEESDAELAIHLRNSIKTHTEMVYEPDQEVNWVLS